MPVYKEKIIVVLPNHLGDVVMATPALRALRRGRPEARIELAVRESLAPVLGGCPWIDRIHTHRIYRSHGILARSARRLAFARRLRGADRVLVLPNSFSGALLAAASGSPLRHGYRRNLRGWLLSHAVPPPTEDGKRVPIAMERYYLDLICSIGCKDTGTTVELFTEPEAETACDRLFESRGIDPGHPLVCVAPGAGYGPSKIWPVAYQSELIRQLLEERLQVGLLYAPGEEPLARRIGAGLGSGPRPVCLGGEGMDLALLKAVVARASLLICNDAGTRHIAAAFQVPALVLMGPTSLRYTNLNLKLTRLLREPVECSPCQLPRCPTDHRCMTRLRPDRVIREAHAALYEEGWRGDLELERSS